MNSWIIRKNDLDLELMSKTLKVSKITANVMANRGIATKNTALKFLCPSQKFMYDANLMKDMQKAIDIIKNSINLGEKIIIYGDYDVDGVMSTTILFQTLQKLGADVDFLLPSREDDGFGLNLQVVNKMHDLEVDLIITCDNGVAAIQEINLAKSLGMKVVVFDHHEPNVTFYTDSQQIDLLPPADAIVNPKQKNCSYPFKKLCAAGVCLKFAELILKDCFDDSHEMNNLFVFAAIATMCDVVDLVDENRVIAKLGLDLINKNAYDNIGLDALLKYNKLLGKEITSKDIGFVIGPCINACGRLQSAELAVDLLLERDSEIAQELAMQIYQLNSRRKDMTNHALENIVPDIAESELIDNRVIVYYNQDVHESIAGILAGRLKEIFWRPVIFFTDSNDIIKGSARSIEEYNIFEELSNCKELFEKFGGHSMAAGLSMQKQNLEILDAKLNNNCTLTDDDLIKKIYIDQQLNFEQIDFKLALELQLLEPFGHLNKEPLFFSTDVCVEKLRIIEEKNTMIFTFNHGGQKSIKGICFGMLENFEDQLYSKYDNYECIKILNGVLRTADLKLDIVYSLEINEYNNDKSLQLRLKDFRIKG